MKNKMIFGIVLVLILLIVVVGLIIPNTKEKDNYDYKIVFYDGMEPGNEYVIEISEDYDIKVSKTSLCSAVDCKPTTDSYLVDFSEENRQIVKENIRAYFVVGNEIEVIPADLNEEALLAIKSIIYKDENILNEIAELSNEDNFLYAISSNRLNCHTVTLMLYSDNTYRYYYTYGNGDGEPKYIQGEYNYDVNKLIDNLDNYEDDGNGPFIITNYTDNYVTYGNNKELSELLGMLDLDLDVCLTD